MRIARFAMVIALVGLLPVAGNAADSSTSSPAATGAAVFQRVCTMLRWQADG